MTTTSKPALYRGLPIPFSALTPEAFQDFVYKCLCEIAPLHQFKMTGGPTNGADEGFDASGVRDSDGAIVCVQCKRLNSNRLGLPVVAYELAKVSLNSALDNSNVKGHLFVTSGTITKELTKLLREQDRKKILDATLECINSHDELKVLKKRCEENKIDPTQATEKYVRGLELFEVWSGRIFEFQIERVNSKLSEVFDRTFALDTVIRDEPRPDFDRDAYLKKFNDSASHVVELMAVRAEFPPNVAQFSAGDPSAQMRSIAPPVVGNSTIIDITDLLKSASSGWATIISGVGGSGKSTTLQLIAHKMAENANIQDDSPLPILIHLGEYDGDLQSLIMRSLNISRGSWKSLSGTFFFLCDGADEIPNGKTALFFSELRQLLVNNPVQAVLTMRGSGLRQQVACDRLHSAWRLLPFTVRSALVVVEKLIDDPNAQSKFMNIFRERLTQVNPDALLLPFGFTSAVASFNKTGTFSETTADLIETVITSRLQHNQSRNSILEERLRDIPDSTIRKLGEEICFELRIVKQKSLIKDDEGHAIIAIALKYLQDDGVFGVSSLSDIDAYKLARHYEIFEPASGGFMRAGHDLIADYLAAPALSRRWKEHLSHLQSTIAQDTWVFAGKDVIESEKGDFISAVGDIDLILASRAAVAMGVSTISVVERRIFERDDQKTTYSSGVAAIAMSILKTDGSFIRLRSRLKEQKGDRSFQAERALAIIGDEEVLQNILKNEDPMASDIVKISGGHIAVWEESGSPYVTLKLARERLRSAILSGEEGVCLSLRTVTRYGDQSDVDLVQKIALQTKNSPTFYASIYCLHELSEDKCIETLNRVVSDDKGMWGLVALEFLSVYGQEVDTLSLLKQLLEFSGDRDAAHNNIKSAIKIIQKNRLSKEAEELLVKSYLNADTFLKSDIWQIVNRHKILLFDDIAISIMKGSNSDELGYAANYASERFIGGDLQEVFAGFCEQQVIELEKNVIINDWHLKRIYNYLLKIGRREVVASSVERILRRYLPEHYRLNREKDQNPQRYLNPPRDDVDSRYDFFVSYDLREYLRIASELAEFISHDVIRLAVAFRFELGAQDVIEAHSKLMAQVAPEILDQELSSISSSHDRIFALSSVARLGFTQTRCEILIRDLPIVIQWHLAYGAIASVLPVLWCREVAEAVVESVSKTTWQAEFGAQLFHDVKSAVIRLMTKDFAESIVKPMIADTLDPHSREILQYWYEVGVAKRSVSEF